MSVVFEDFVVYITILFLPIAYAYVVQLRYMETQLLKIGYMRVPDVDLGSGLAVQERVQQIGAHILVLVTRADNTDALAEGTQRLNAQLAEQEYTVQGNWDLRRRQEAFGTYAVSFLTKNKEMEHLHPDVKDIGLPWRMGGPTARLVLTSRTSGNSLAIAVVNPHALEGQRRFQTPVNAVQHAVDVLPSGESYTLPIDPNEEVDGLHVTQAMRPVPAVVVGEFVRRRPGILEHIATMAGLQSDESGHHVLLTEGFTSVNATEQLTHDGIDAQLLKTDFYVRGMQSFGYFTTYAELPIDTDGWLPLARPASVEVEL